MAENDVHFPQLTVGQTLLFAAKARAPRDYTFPGLTRDLYAEIMRDVFMATYGIMHTMNTNVGGVIIPGVSGGERKRVSIAEAALSGSPLQCWDNSTRGLDSANALEFCRTIKLSTDLTGATALISLYQGSQDAYEASLLLHPARHVLTVCRYLTRSLFSTKVVKSTLVPVAMPKLTLQIWVLTVPLAKPQQISSHP